jgi:CspA family cold shock protein
VLAISCLQYYNLIDSVKKHRLIRAIYEFVFNFIWNEKMSAKETGHVKWFNDDKGFGFISRDNGQEDVFVHFRSIVSTSSRKSLVEGQRVEFIVTKGAKGFQAEEVTMI